MSRDVMPRWLTSRRGKAIRRAVVYLLFLLVCLEVGARVILSSTLIENFVQGNYDYGRRQKWINARRKLPPGTSIAYTFDEYHPRRGWSLKPNLRNVTAWGGKSLNSNSKGLRGLTEYRYERAPTRTRIAVLGDSFTFGQEVSDHETFCARLEQAIPNSQVLNFGNHGYGHDQMLIYFRSEVRRYKPDIVILGFVYENMRRNLLSFRDYAKPRFELVDNRLVPRNTPVPPPEHFLRSYWRRCKLWDLLAIIHETQRWKYSVTEAHVYRTAEAILDVLAREIAQIDARALFVFFPVAELIGDTGPRPSPPEQFLLDFCGRRESVRGFSLQPRFDAEDQKGVKLNRVSHWNARAHAIAAAEIMGFMEQNKLIRVHR